ncbi:MAG: acyl-CoA thioesterase [Candidatus Hydrogenedentes bacterium]|nr:acyl-CoA thioesterase [Candidatus Hydrogenedentota bacterium]
MPDSTTPSLEDFEIVTRHMVMEKDLNPFGNLYGGMMLSWLDEGAALYVMEKIGYANFVTVSLDNVNFKAPGHRGDAIVLYCRVLRTGRSSIVVQSKALAHEPITGAKRDIITCQITYVCLMNERPYPYFQSAEYAEWRTRSAAENPAL